VIIVGGHAVQLSADDSRLVTEGDVFVVGPHNVHAYRDAKDLRVIKILFRPEKLRVELLDLSVVPGYQALFSFESLRRKDHAREAGLHLGPKELSIVLHYAEALAHELQMRSPGFAFIAYAWFMQLVGYLSRGYTLGLSARTSELD
jgi:AraC-like protein